MLLLRASGVLTLAMMKHIKQALGKEPSEVFDMILGKQHAIQTSTLVALGQLSPDLSDQNRSLHTR